MKIIVIVSAIFTILHCQSSYAANYYPGQAIRSWDGTPTGYGSTGQSSNTYNISDPQCTGNTCNTTNVTTLHDTYVSYPNIIVTPTFSIKVCSVNAQGVAGWATGKTIPAMVAKNNFVTNLSVKYKYDADFNNAQCLASNPCQPKTGQPGEPFYTGLPYNSDYYETVGLCVQGCVIKPDSSSPILSGYASDGSGWAVGPWKFNGQDCITGVHDNPPAQKTPEEQCDSLRAVCEAECDGRAYVHDCNTGSCQCFGAPGYTTDPPNPPHNTNHRPRIATGARITNPIT